MRSCDTLGRVHSWSATGTDTSSTGTYSGCTGNGAVVIMLWRTNLNSENKRDLGYE